MAWRLPPKYKKDWSFTGTPEVCLEKMSTLLVNQGYEIHARSPYTLSARKKMKMSFLSFFSFSRPVLELFVTADEDGKLTLRGTYNYPGFNNMACYDSGRTKKEVEKLLAGLA